MLSLQILFLFLVLAATQTTDPVLLAKRMVAVQKWIERTAGSEQMDLVFTDEYSTPEVAHIVRDSADYGPREIAREYDRVILDLFHVFGFNPSMLRSYYDPSTVTWLDVDTIQVDFNTDLRTEYNMTTQLYAIDQTGFRNRDIYVFASGTSRVSLAYSIQDPSAIAAFAHAQSVMTNDVICGYFLMPACSNHLADTGYADVADCVSFLNSLATTNPCPYPTRSNTPQCRLTHAWSAGLLPSVHCAHTKRQSVTCSDTCMPACLYCHADAECVPTYPTLFTPVYKCQCKNGFVGNGSHCVPKLCDSASICSGALYGSYECSTGKCKCKDTFVQDHTPGNTNLCVCPDGGQIIYQNGNPICVPKGRCISEQWECTQDYTKIKCKAAGNNTFTNFKTCICNYGFQGGYEYPCSCPSGRRVLWSNAHNSELCLTSSECTLNWHCTYPSTCTIPTGSQIGTCN